MRLFKPNSGIVPVICISKVPFRRFQGPVTSLRVESSGSLMKAMGRLNLSLASEIKTQIVQKAIFESKH
jgi:hypothetical protein